MSEKRILTIQDISCVGQCSLTVALPILSAFGLETAILPSAVLSTHTGGFTGYTFRDLTEDIPAIAAHWKKENLKFDAFYTGYVGSKKQLEYISDIIKTLGTDDAVTIIDPVMGDNGKLYAGFNEDFAAEMAKFCSLADVILPNFTEAAFLLKEPFVQIGEYDEAYVEGLLKRLAGLGAKNVVLTGVSFDKSKLGVAIYDGKDIYYDFNDYLPVAMHGTGDVFASAFTGAMASGKTIQEAAALAADFVVDSIKATESTHKYGVRFEKALHSVNK